MSDKDKLVILILFFVFLVSFFIFVIVLGDRGDSTLFQYLLFIAALTMAFTGFLGATGNFTTQGQTLGGGAAIFLILVLGVVGLKPYFEPDNSLKKLVGMMKANPDEKLSNNEALLRAMNEITKGREMRPTKCPEKPDKLKLSIYSWEPPKLIKAEDELFTVYTAAYDSKEGSYEIPTKNLEKEDIYLESDQFPFGPAIKLKYDPNIPEIRLYVKKK